MNDTTDTNTPADTGEASETAALMAVIGTLPPKAANLLAVEVLLTDPETLGDDTLETCLYLLRERLRQE